MEEKNISSQSTEQTSGAEISERVRKLKELKDIRDLIDEIEMFWKAPYFDENTARRIIKKVNDNHFENVFLYNMLTYPAMSNQGSGVPIESASQAHLWQDLQWKHFYLNAKLCGKAAEEITKEWTSMFTAPKRWIPPMR